MADITLHNVVKRYDKNQTIHGVDLQINSGEFVVFVGPSGCGKSTLLRMVAGLEEITEGDLYIDAVRVNDMAPSDRGVAMVFQSYALYPHMTVAENMGFGLRMNGIDKVEIEQRVNIAAKSLKMEQLLDRKPKDMSGGQRQRVAIGRAIVRAPKVFLFDEPLSNLDAELRVEMRLQISKLHHELGNTMIYVTHDQVEAMTLADKIVVLRSGRIEQVGTPLELYHKPANDFVAGFIGSPKMNFIDAVIDAIEGDIAVIRLPDDQLIRLPVNPGSTKRADKVRFGIRPEHIHVDHQQGDITLTFQSEVVERLGNSTYIFGNYCGQDGFKVHLQGDKFVKLYENVPFSIRLIDCHLFDAQGMAIAKRDISIDSLQ